MEEALRWIAILLAVGAALFILDRLGLYLESRGWIYYRKRTPNPGSLGNALLEMHAMLEPEKRYVVEVRQEEKVEEEGSGDPPVAGGR